MFKTAFTAFAGALLTSGASAFDSADKTKLACYLYDDFTVFDLRSLASEEGFAQGALHYNFCNYVKEIEGNEATHETFAYLKEGPKFTKLTDDDVVTSKIVTKENEEGDLWVEFTQNSDSLCKEDAESGEKTNFSFTTEVQCLKDGDKKAKFEFVSGPEGECNKKITIKHASGCPVYSGKGYVRFILQNPWILGIFFVLSGGFIGLYGRKFFPYAVAAVGAVVSFTILAVLCSAFGGFGSTVGAVICTIVSLVIAVLIGIFLRRKIWISIGILGVVGGFFAGTLVYSLFLAAFSWANFYAMLFISFLFAIAGGFLAYYVAPSVVLFGTSGFGAYVFMRGWTYFFGGYPSENEMFSKLKDGVELQLGWPFWVYLGVFAFSFVFAFYYQARHEDHEELEQDENYKRSKTTAE